MIDGVDIAAVGTDGVTVAAQVEGEVAGAGECVDVVMDEVFEHLVVAVVVEHGGDAAALLVKQRHVAGHAPVEVGVGDAEVDEAVDGGVVGCVGDGGDDVGCAGVDGVSKLGLVGVGQGCGGGAD